MAKETVDAARAAKGALEGGATGNRGGDARERGGRSAPQGGGWAPGWRGWWAALVLSTASAVLGAPTGARAAPPRGSGSAAVPLLRVSELMSDPLLVEDRAGEYVEIANLSPCPVRVSDLSLLLPSGRRLRGPAGSAAVAPGGVVVFSPGGLVPGSVRLKGLRLPGRAGRVELSWRGRLVDVAQWTGRWPWPKHRAGRALERRGPRTDGRRGRAWRHSRTPLRVVERGSPGRLPRGAVWRPVGSPGPRCARADGRR